MVHHCCSKQKVKRGLWSPEEDEKLVNYITTHGHSSWSSVPKHAGLQRCGKSCRLRWINYLRPDLKRGSFNEEEERTIIEVHRILGNRWAQIAKHLPGRTDNEVKNFWNSCIKKKLLAQGLDPNTHNLLSSHQKMAKKNNTYNNVTKCTTTYRRMPPNSTTLVFSGDNDSPVNIIRQAIQSCFPSRNNGRLQNNVADSSKDDHNQKIAVNDSSKPDSNLVIASDVNNFSYMVDESSIWNDPIIIDEMEQQSSAQTEVLVQSQPSILSDHGVDEYGFIKADMNQKTYIQNQPSNRTTDNNNPFGNLLAHLNNQCLDDTLTTFNSSSFDVGFGDYSSIIMSGSLYGDMGSMAMDQVAWGNC